MQFQGRLGSSAAVSHRLEAWLYSQLDHQQPEVLEIIDVPGCCCTDGRVAGSDGAERGPEPLGRRSGNLG